VKIQTTHFESEDQTELAGEWNFPDPVIFGGRRPLVVMAHNRAGRDRNCNGPAIPHYEGFSTLAKGLTAAGYAVFRYDKRGCGQSQGKFAPDEEKSLAEDYYSAVMHAVAHPDVDDWRVFLLAQSQGTRLLMTQFHEIQKHVLVQGVVMLSNVVEASNFSNISVPFLIVCGKEDHAFREISESKLVHDAVSAGLEQGLDSCLGLVLPGLGHLLSPEEHPKSHSGEVDEAPLQFFNTRMDPSVVDAILPWLRSRAEAEPDSEDGATPWWRSHFDEEYMQLHRHWEEGQARTDVDRILKDLQLSAGAHVVDLGSGYGRHAIELASRGYAVTAIDISEPLLAQTIRAAAEKNIPVIGTDYPPKPGQIQIIHGDARTVKIPHAAEALIHFDSALGYFDEVEDDERVLETVSRLVKIGGKIFFEIANRDWLVRELQGRGYSRDFDETPYGVLLKETRWDWFKGITVERRKITRPDQSIRRSELRVRHYTLSQWRAMLEKHSLDVLNILPGIRETEPFSGTQSRRMCLIARRTFQFRE
jgi:SAM-dependent methyltransferase